MPNATKVDTTERYALKSCPPDGFVELKRMSYGESVERRAMMKLSFATGGKKNADFKGEMAMASVEIQMYEFRHCIVDHNLTDSNDRPLDFNNPMDFRSLDPRIGGEIEKYITEMNEFDDEEESEGN